MATPEEWVLWLHIASGTIAVLAGVGALLSRKGGWHHRRAGKGFLVSMAAVVLTVFVLTAIEPSAFRLLLTLVAIFSGYLAFSGYRTLSRKGPTANVPPVDWAAAGLVILACIALGGWGVHWLLDGQSFGLVMTVFGGIGIAFGTLDVRSFAGNEPGDWMVSHLQRMVAAVIATVSAVSAVNLTPLLGIMAWLWPTLVGVPLIAYWSRKYSN